MKFAVGIFLLLHLSSFRWVHSKTRTLFRVSRQADITAAPNPETRWLIQMFFNICVPVDSVNDTSPLLPFFVCMLAWKVAHLCCLPALTWVVLECVSAGRTCRTGEPFCCLTGPTGAAPTPTLVCVSPHSKLIQPVEITFYMNSQVLGDVCSLDCGLRQMTNLSDRGGWNSTARKDAPFDGTSFFGCSVM